MSGNQSTPILRRGPVPEAWRRVDLSYQRDVGLERQVRWKQNIKYFHFLFYMSRIFYGFGGTLDRSELSRNQLNKLIIGPQLFCRPVFNNELSLQKYPLQKLWLKREWPLKLYNGVFLPEWRLSVCQICTDIEIREESIRFCKAKAVQIKLPVEIYFHTKSFFSQKHPVRLTKFSFSSSSMLSLCSFHSEFWHQ